VSKRFSSGTAAYQNNGQSNLELGSIAALELLVCLYYTIQVGVLFPKFPLSLGKTRALSNMMLLGSTRVSLPNGISFRAQKNQGFFKKAQPAGFWGLLGFGLYWVLDFFI